MIKSFVEEVENIIKILIKTRNKPRLKYQKKESGVINILGTGPSFSQSIKELMDQKSGKSFAVNDFASSDYFLKIKPEYYILVDNAYWQPAERCTQRDFELREKTFQNFLSVDWPMTIIIPSEVYSKKTFSNNIINNNITFLPLIRTNLLYTGSSLFFKYLKKNFGGYFNNILACAIYSSINLGFEEIRIYGAEHSWTKDIRVDDKNRVCTIKRHFFESDSELVPWLDSDGKPFTMDVILHSLARTFQAYKLLHIYAELMGVKIFNYTPESFIDSFQRRK